MAQRGPEALAQSSVLQLLPGHLPVEIVPLSAVLRVVPVLSHACTLADQDLPFFVPLDPAGGAVYDPCVPSAAVRRGAAAYAAGIGGHGRHRSVVHVDTNEMYFLKALMRTRPDVAI